MAITEKAKQKLDTASKEMKDAIESLKNEVEGLSQKVKEKLKDAGSEMKENAQELTQEVRNLTEKVTSLISQNLITQKKKRPGLKVQVNKDPFISYRDRWEHPFLQLQQATNRLFDDFFKDFGFSPFEKQNLFGLKTDVAVNDWPSVDMSENEKNICITAEMPGLDKRNIDIAISGNRITIRGEKKQHEEEKGQNFYRLERSYGSFERTFQLPCEVESEKGAASFKDGVLHVILPKTVAARERVKKITVRAA